VTFRRRESLEGYAARYGGGASVACLPGGAGGVGGMVVCGFGEVRAYTLAAEIVSAKVLNSATGVICELYVSMCIIQPAVIGDEGEGALELLV